MKKLLFPATIFIVSAVFGLGLSLIVSSDASADIAPPDYCRMLVTPVTVMTSETGPLCPNYKYTNDPPSYIYYVYRCYGQMSRSGTYCDCVMWDCWGPNSNIE